MPYANRSSALTKVVHAMGLPTCHGCGCGLPPASGNGGSARKWCGPACRTFARRRRLPNMMRPRPVEELEAETVAALEAHTADRASWSHNMRAMSLLTLLGHHRG
ncbi:hypothetical protein GCM10022234_35880 [Aeromicrobium panaciterrae]